MVLARAILLFIILVISAIPLNLAVKLLGGKSGILKVIIANLAVAAIATFLDSTVGWYAGLLSFLLMLLVYKLLFNIGWVRALLAWLLQFVIIALFIVILALIGVSLIVF